MSSTSNSSSTTVTAETDQVIKPDSVALLDSPKVTKVLNSDNSLDVLLTRLKQSIITCDELARFIKKKAIFEDEHYNQMRKVARNTRDLLKHDSRALRQDSFLKSFDEILEFDEKLFNVGSSYVKALTQMYDQLVSLSSTVSRSRKSIKEEGRRKEKECAEAIAAAEKAKTKYNNLCAELEKLKGSDPSKKTFTLKGSKTSSQQEEDVTRKIETADADYKSKVVNCKKLKDELLKFHRPSNSKALKNLILEIDIAISAQLQKYSTWNETLIMNSGVTISPLKQDLKKPSMRHIASSVDNEKDLYNYLLKSGPAQNRALVPVEYQAHPSFGGKKPNTKVFPAYNNNNNSNNASTSGAAVASGTMAGAAAGSTVAASTSVQSPASNGLSPINQQQQQQQSQRSPIVSPQHQQHQQHQQQPPPPPPPAQPILQQQQQQQQQRSDYNYSSLDPASSRLVGPRPLSSISDSNDSSTLPPGTTINAKTFGVPISMLASSEDDLVPDIVNQCITIIEKYGLELEGIYRTSANAAKLKEMKELIDSDPANIRKIGPSSNSNILDSDIYCIASLLKLFFSSLPEPLLTNESYSDLINAAKIQDQNERYITLHHIIFKLPDESYWTLRALILHLSKVVAASERNKMNEKNLGIVWGPTLMFSETTDDITYQGKVIEELILNANNLYRDE